MSQANFTTMDLVNGLLLESQQQQPKTEPAAKGVKVKDSTVETLATKALLERTQGC